MLILGASLTAIARFGHVLVDAVDRSLRARFERRAAVVEERVIERAPAAAPFDALHELVRAELKRSMWKNTALGILIAAVFFVLGRILS